MLGGPRGGDADPQPDQALDGRECAVEAFRREQRDRWRRGEAEHELGHLTGLAGPETKDGLERRRREIDLALGQRLGSTDLGARRLEHDGEAFAREVALHVGHPKREILR